MSESAVASGRPAADGAQEAVSYASLTGVVGPARVSSGLVREEATAVYAIFCSVLFFGRVNGNSLLF